MWKSVLAISVGATIGALLRWWLGNQLNSAFPAIPPGTCGGLTTFSTFSAELVTLLQQGRGAWALGAAATHLCGSVLMTLAGVGTVHWIRS